MPRPRGLAGFIRYAFKLEDMRIRMVTQTGGCVSVCFMPAKAPGNACGAIAIMQSTGPGNIAAIKEGIPP